MDQSEFDNLSRALVTLGTRRGAVGALAGLLGLGIVGAADAAGKSKQKRRRQRRRTRQDRRVDRRDPLASRGVKILLENPLERGVAATVEFGYAAGPQSQCCQGQSAYTLQPGEVKEYTTAELGGYAWIDNKYFISIRNRGLVPPDINSSIGGAAYIYKGICCKPGGSVGPYFRLWEGETRALALQDHVFVMIRLDDEPDYKVYIIRMM